MEYSLQQDQDAIVVKMAGELTLEDEEKFRALSAETTQLPGSKCLIDLSKLEFLDSAGLGLLLVMKELCEAENKTVSLKVGGSAVREILDISEFGSLIPIVG